MKLKCIRDVIMNNGTIAFTAGREYIFEMNAHGEIAYKHEHGVHMFKASGEDSWPTYFYYDLEDGA